LYFIVLLGQAPVPESRERPKVSTYKNEGILPWSRNTISYLNKL